MVCLRNEQGLAVHLNDDEWEGVRAAARRNGWAATEDSSVHVCAGDAFALAEAIEDGDEALEDDLTRLLVFLTSGGFRVEVSG